MEPIELDLEFTRGDTMSRAIEITDAMKNQLNITPENCELTFTARDASKNIVIQKFYSAGDIEVQGKKLVLIIQHDDTKNLKMNGKYKYDIQFTSGDYYKTIVKGIISLSEEQTY